MKRFEKDLRGLLDRSVGGIVETVPSEYLTEDAARELKARGLVTLHPAGDNLLYIRLTDAGRLYFTAKAEKRRAAWLNRLVSYILGVLTPLTVWLIEWLIKSGT